MVKLPTNFVQAPAFDSPLRRTDKPELAVVAEDAERATPAEAETQQPEAPTVPTGPELVHRCSVRFTQTQWEALQTECFRRRMKNQKTNVAELIREIMDEWITDA